MVEIKKVSNNNGMWKIYKSIIKFTMKTYNIGDIMNIIQKWGQLRRYFGNIAFISKLKSKSYEKVQNDEN